MNAGTGTSRSRVVWLSLAGALLVAGVLLAVVAPWGGPGGGAGDDGPGTTSGKAGRSDTAPRAPHTKDTPGTVRAPSTARVGNVPDTRTVASGGAEILHEDFGGAWPNPRWTSVRDGDFREAVVSVEEGRLKIRVATIGTRDDTVKHLGIRTAEPIVDFSSPIDVGAEIDWNDQANGCYLRASLYLCPTRTDGTAKAERDWLVFQYVGVPPGKNARALLARHRDGNLRHLFTEGWPKEQRTGRRIARQRVVLRLGPETVEVFENGKSIFGPAEHGVGFRRAYLHIEVSSHSNYPPREIFFDNVTIGPAAQRP